MPRRHLMVLLAISFALCSCRSWYYDFWEGMGVEKRDLLQDELVKTKDKQQQLQDEFKDTLDKIRHHYKFDGGALESTYDKIAAAHQRAENKTAALRSERKELATVANDLFREWRDEALSIKDKTLRRDSLAKLTQSQARFKAMTQVLDRVDKRLSKVLEVMRDQKLYLKHNLNALAVDSLKLEMGKVEKEISRLIDEIGHSIAEAESFSKTLKT